MTTPGPQDPGAPLPDGSQGPSTSPPYGPMPSQQPYWAPVYAPQPGGPTQGYSGYPPPPGLIYPVAPTPRVPGRAVAILILGIAGVTITAACCLGWIAGIVALALAPGARREIRESHGALTGNGLVTAGVVCAWVSIGLAVFGLCAWLLVTVLSSLGGVQDFSPTF